MARIDIQLANLDNEQLNQLRQLEKQMNTTANGQIVLLAVADTGSTNK